MSFVADLAALKSRRLALLVDDLSEGSPRAVLVSPAQECTAALVNEILAISGGLTFVAISPARREALMLEPMRSGVVESGATPHTNPYTAQLCVSVEAREGVSTGISAADRARTISILGENEPSARKLVKPGHVFPLETRNGGVLVRNALPEGALDLIVCAGFSDAALFVDLLTQDGEIAEMRQVHNLSREKRIPLFNLSEVTRHRLENERLVYKIAEARLPSRLAGELRSCIYKTDLYGGEHLALIKDPINLNAPVLTRVQPEFTVADVFGGAHPSTRNQLHNSLRAIEKNGSGVLIYLRRPTLGECRAQVSSWQKAVQKKPASMMREYGLGAQILRDLGVKRIELLTSSTKQLSGLTTFGIEIAAQRPIPNYEAQA